MLPQYRRIKLDKPSLFRTLNGQMEVNYEIVTEVPREFNDSNFMSWKLTHFENKQFDGLIGQNILKCLKASINIGQEYIEVNGNKIGFCNACPYAYENVHTLEGLEIDNVVDRLFRDDMTKDESGRLEILLDRNNDLFFQEGMALSHTHEIQHEIITKMNNPVYSKIYRYPQIHEEEINRQMKEMLRQNIITESNSPYNSPIWIVPKKADYSGKKKWRIVIDYRKLNEITVDDKFPMPNIEGILDKLGKSQYFTTLDLAKGFHQIKIKKEDRKKTAFSTPLGHYEFVRMPFGLKNAPSTFQRLMNSVLRDLINKICVVYLDDILIFSTSMEEHMTNIQKVFDRLREHNLKIQVDKCRFFAKETDYLGHILTTDGIKPNPAKVESIQKLKLPETQKQIKSFLGTTGYYRKFIKDYAKTAHGMTKYLRKDTKINKNDPQYTDAFQKLKRQLINPPILKYPDYSKKFKLVTDASDYAIGAVLMQDDHPISYASRTLNDHEKRYATVEKELLAIVWAVTYYRPYIYGRPFDLATDHQPLVWLYNKHKGKDINPRLQRWLMELGEYNVNMNYIKGKENKIADFLSRIDSNTGEIHAMDNEGEMIRDNLSNSAPVHSQQEEQDDRIPILNTVVNRFQTQIILTEHKVKETETINRRTKIFISRDDVETDYMSDIFRRLLKNGRVGVFSELPDDIYNRVQLKLIDLFGTRIKFFKCSHHAKDMNNEDDTYRQIAKYHKLETGHGGITENYEGLKRKIYFKNLKILVHKYINNCDTCNKSKYDRNPIKPKFKITETPSDVNQIIHLDVYTIKKHSFMTFIDRFSKHAVAIYLEDRNSTTIVEKLRQFLSTRSKPIKIVTDNEFNSTNVKVFLRQEGIEVHFTKPNNHTGNSDIERLHSTISEKFRALESEGSNLSTQERIFKCVEWYNKSIHSLIRERPIDVVEGRVSKGKIEQTIRETKQRIIDRRNETREDYERTDDEGYVKNYKTLRHKYEPRYRKLKLENIHPTNIKRSNKFSGQMDHTRYTADANTNDNGGADNSAY